MKNHSLFLAGFLFTPVFLTLPVEAAILSASDGNSYEYLGASLAREGGSCLAGATGVSLNDLYSSGAAYFFRNFSTGEGVDHEEVKLIPSNPLASSVFGSNVAFSGQLGVVTRHTSYTSPNLLGVTAYLYQHLDTASGTVTENARLANSSGYNLESAVSLSGTTCLAASYYLPVASDAVLLFRNLDTATGTVLENGVLLASDRARYDGFGTSISFTGDRALIGAPTEERGGSYQGAAYYYRGLNAAVGNIVERAKLIASNQDSGAYFGSAVSLSGDNALVGAEGQIVGGEENLGRAYYFANLDAATGVVQPLAELAPADYDGEFRFGSSVSLSGTDALVSMNQRYDDDTYLYRHLDTAHGITYETVRLTRDPKNQGNFTEFGFRVSLEGDVFAIVERAANGGYSGDIYTGSISAVTTLDLGNSYKTAAGVSFISRVDWIIGETTDRNEVDLLEKDLARVRQPERAVYIGKNAGSDGNLLNLAGELDCNFVYIGSANGNTGNVLQVTGSKSKVEAGALRLANGNTLRIEGNLAAVRDLLKTAPLQVWVSGAWKTVTMANYQRLVRISQSGGYTVIVPAAS